MEPFIGTVLGVEGVLFTKVFEIAQTAAGTSLEGAPEKIVPLFDHAVDCLRDPKQTPNIHINKLVTNLWRLVGNKITPTAVTDAKALPSPGIAFWGEIRVGQKVGMVLIPHNWADLCIEDQNQQMGGVCFNAAQAMDFYFDRMGANNHTLKRAAAYEAEFIKVLLDRRIPLNSWQTKIIDAMPKGLDSLPAALRYDLQPVVAGDFLLIDEFYKR